ncbi:right-handed parallel beta-helix repeat-containing protein [Testudinibacter sp. TR-2022]|uniref:right-handed parallel beta-helix repeat-containing protein n=1 Tax=Testudinibacter sp. TR-2022 TaxID=2585029 RepID=UPI002279C793|nr:exopolygalacturonate lyase [Testudinibacter sp. TR-2022]
MKKIVHLILPATILMFPFSIWSKTSEPAPIIWQSITFGQSTDLNFGSTILPEKVSTNETLVNATPVTPGPLAPSFTLESRGGKLANSHEGVTFYYTELPVNTNFILSANITLEQLGPETGANPNRQEGAGIMVRDILGKAREVPQPIGYEEFPAASNMVMNFIRSHSRDADGKININAAYREGIQDPWGTAGNRIYRQDYVEGIDFSSKSPFHLTLEKTDQQFIFGYQQGEIKQQITLEKLTPGILAQQNPEKQYLGFFASRNAKISVQDATLQTSQGTDLSPTSFSTPAIPVLLTQASASITIGDSYTFQARANYDGHFSLWQDNQIAVQNVTVKAGDFFSHALSITTPSSEVKVRFVPDLPQGEKEAQENTITVRKSSVLLEDPMNLHVAVDGTSQGNGTLEKPLDLTSAIQWLPPGGTLFLQAGDYPALTLPSQSSGTAQAYKTLKGKNAKVRFIGEVLHQASFWHVENIEVAGASLIVQGSYNEFRNITTHSAPDTGFQITSPEGVGRALWASHNIVKDSISFNNMDKSQINADGFAAKMRVGDGNTFIRCISHHNIDDGWDLFNKVEDGPNGVVTILDSIAFMNGQTLQVQSKSASIGNGFKLGGEGIPVAHIVKNSLAFHNNMDGFTDNFNPGALLLENNLAIDNRRFNYLFRKSPYEKASLQGTFINNQSFRFYQPSPYPDVVNGNQMINNDFLLSTTAKNAKVRYLNELQKLSKVDYSQTIPGLKEAKAVQTLLTD